MPVHVLKDLSDLDRKVPPHIQRISIPYLNDTSDCTHKSVKGRVVVKGPLVPGGVHDYILKTVIQEDPQQSSTSENTSVNVILFGALAKDFSQSVSQGDVLLLAGFAISKSPTVKKDRLHPWNLQLKGSDACVYVCPSSSSLSGRTPAVNEPKYTYVPLNQLKPGMVVNVYAVVTFFKQPFPTKGTDYCSTLKIMDQSNVKVGCTIFSEKLEDHPKIFKMGDIIRLHRVKTQLFNGSITLLTSLGWSTVTFDGIEGSPVVPRTSNRSFHFGEEDRRTVVALRQWAVRQSLLPSEPTKPLSTVQPRMYFDLTCQLLAKAPMDSSCTLLKVWDGTRCVHPLLNVAVEPKALEGENTLTKDRENLTANVLVYDNHVEVARGLKPGMFLRIYNLHAVPQGAAGHPPEQPSHLGFHLHGGTSYGRGLRILPSDSPDLQTLKRVLESHVDSACDGVNDDTLLDVWYTPPESVVGHRDGEADAEVDADVEFLTVRTCGHMLQQVTLAQVRRSVPPRVFHVRAQVKSYLPQRLYQSLKLYCPGCKTIREVPDEEAVAGLFQEALSDSRPCSEDWAVTSGMDSREPGRTVTLHVVCDMMLEDKHSQLVFVQGVTLEEMCRISPGHKNMVPVRSAERRMTLLDLSAPFLFSGEKQYYGCKQCSQVTVVEPVVSGVEEWDEGNIAEALGVRLMQYVLLMKLELKDESGTLEALLWEDAESFFHVSAADTAANQELQGRVQQIMDKLRPPGGSIEERPWLDVCLHAYTVEENGQSQVCYQIFNTESRRAPASSQATR